MLRPDFQSDLLTTASSAVESKSCRLGKNSVSGIEAMLIHSKKGVRHFVVRNGDAAKGHKL